MAIKYVIGIDPSGNFYEGKGTTGLALIEAETCAVVAMNYVSAKMYNSQLQYWQAVIDEITNLTMVVEGTKIALSIEDYLLYSNTAQSQINSTFETPQIIGALKWEFRYYPIYIRPAAQVKRRWSDDVLLKKGILIKNRRTGWCVRNTQGELLPVMEHQIDALRHAIHCAKFDLKKEK